MYIEFQLPTGAGGMAAAHAAHIIRKEIAEWADKHQVTYKTKAVKYTLRLCLESDQSYTHFQLSWDPFNQHSNRYRIVKTES